MTDDAGEPGTDAALRAELIAIEQDWSQAIVANDADRIAAFMTDDWVMVSDTGVMSGERFLTVVRSGQLSHSAMVPAAPSLVRSYGQTAVVTARVTSTASYQGQRVDADEWTTDVFVRRDGRWLCSLTHVTAATSV
jgi:ketosteroid isomerase-like protein